MFRRRKRIDSANGRTLRIVVDYALDKSLEFEPIERCRVNMRAYGKGSTPELARLERPCLHVVRGLAHAKTAPAARPAETYAEKNPASVSRPELGRICDLF